MTAYSTTVEYMLRYRYVCEACGYETDWYKELIRETVQFNPDEMPPNDIDLTLLALNRLQFRLINIYYDIDNEKQPNTGGFVGCACLKCGKWQSWSNGFNFRNMLIAIIWCAITIAFISLLIIFFINKPVDYYYDNIIRILNITSIAVLLLTLILWYVLSGLRERHSASFIVKNKPEVEWPSWLFVSIVCENMDVILNDVNEL